MESEETLRTHFEFFTPNELEEATSGGGARYYFFIDAKNLSVNK